MSIFCPQGAYVLFYKKFDLLEEGGPYLVIHFVLKANSSHSYERACSLRSQARDLFFFASGTLSFNLFPPGSPPNPNENIKAISAIWSNCLFSKKCHCYFIYLVYLIDSIRRNARRESPDVIKFDKSVVFYWIREELDASLSTKIKTQN